MVAVPEELIGEEPVHLRETIWTLARDINALGEPLEVRSEQYISALKDDPRLLDEFLRHNVPHFLRVQTRNQASKDLRQFLKSDSPAPKNEDRAARGVRNMAKIEHALWNKEAPFAGGLAWRALMTSQLSAIVQESGKQILGNAETYVTARELLKHVPPGKRVDECLTEHEFEDLRRRAHDAIGKEFKVA